MKLSQFLIGFALGGFMLGIIAACGAMAPVAAMDQPRNCTRMKATDTLVFHGHRQHAERFVECSVGRWPNVHSEFRYEESR